MPTSANELSATEALALLHDGSLSVEALASTCLARALQREPEVHAWARLDAASVLAQARAMDRDTRSPRGPLWGLPIGIKDVILTADPPTQYNSPLYTGFHPVMDAACVSVLRQAGALVFGKTETVEFAATGRPAPTANPWDLRRTPGGSSSGSAAAVADRHVPLALGTQTGGSMIRPASFCGVFALKPTWGLVSTEGVKAFAPSLDTVGWHARSAEDLSLLLDVFDPAPLQAVPEIDLRRARVARCRSPAWPQADASTRRAFDVASAALQAAGAIVEELVLPSPFERMHEWQRVVMRSEGRASFLAQHRADPAQLHPDLRALIEQPLFTRSQQLEASDGAAACRRVFDRLAAPYDAVLTPSAVGEAPPGLQATGSYAFNAMWSLLQVPCIHVPLCMGDAGMPVGLTLTGPRYSDRTLLGIASAMSRLPGCPNSGYAPIAK